MEIKLSSLSVFGLLLAISFIGVQGQVNYDSQKIVRALIPDQTHLQHVQDMELDVWSCAGELILGNNDIRVNDATVMQLYDHNVQMVCLIPNLQNYIDRETQEISLSGDLSIQSDYAWFSTYQRYDAFLERLQGLAYDYPNIVTYDIVGTTFEARDIPVVRITGTGSGLKQKVLVIAGEEAREWAAPAAVAFHAVRLATLYGYDEDVTFLLDNIEVHIIPIANPDGYEYSWTKARMWRKNRKLNSDGSFGVDLNKNWDYDQWGCDKSPVSNTFCGTNAFSEQETTSIRDYFVSHAPFHGSVVYNGYSQQVLRPYGSSSVPPSNDPVLKTIGDEWARVMSEYIEDPVVYTSLSAYSAYNSSGSARDWLYDNGVPLSYSVSLRDNGVFGFVLPQWQILPTCGESFSGFQYFLHAVRNYA